jgi:CDGSH-type Zn-finger protein
MSEKIIAQPAPYVLEMEPGTYWFCTCGRSAKQPFCDGAHKGTGLAPMKVEIEEAKRVAWCGCKQSANGCFCDGTHKSLGQ